MGRRHPFNLFDESTYRTVETIFLGADRLFGHLNEIHNTVTDTYPPYNVEKVGDDFVISLAVAGFKKAEVKVTVEKHPTRVLIVTGEREEKNGKEYVHKGIGARNFSRHFALDEHLNVESVKLADGVLSVSLKQAIPEDKKPEVFDIK